MSPEFWVILVTSAVGLTIASHALPIFLRRRGWQIPRTFDGWRDEFRRRFERCIETDFAAVEAKVELFEMIGHVPKDFDVTIFLTTNLGAAIHRPVVIEAERRGYVPDGTFTRIYGESIEETAMARNASGVSDRPPAASSEESEVDVAASSSAQSNVRKLGDRPVPRARGSR